MYAWFEYETIILIHFKLNENYKIIRYHFKIKYYTIKLYKKNKNSYIKRCI